MQKSVKIALIAVVVVVVLGGVGFYFAFLKDNSPPPPSFSASPSTSAGANTPTTADGTWKVQQQTSPPDDSSDYTVYVGYRVQELFAGDTIKKDAVGRTTDVSGTMTIKGQTVSDVDMSATLTSLKSDRSPRDNIIHTLGLQSDQFPKAEFKSTAPVQLPSAPQLGAEQKVTVTGDLTVHGQTKSVSVPLTAKWDGATIQVVGSIPVTFGDYGMQAISIPTVNTDDKGTVEIALTFVPST